MLPRSAAASASITRSACRESGTCGASSQSACAASGDFPPLRPATATGAHRLSSRPGFFQRRGECGRRPLLSHLVQDSNLRSGSTTASSAGQLWNSVAVASMPPPGQAVAMWCQRDQGTRLGFASRKEPPDGLALVCIAAIHRGGEIGPT